MDITSITTCNVVVLDYSTGIVNFLTVPEEYSEFPDVYLFEILRYKASDISWMYSDNLQVSLE